MAGIAILKTLASFEFPDGEPAYTEEVAQRINERMHQGKEPEAIGIDRILNQRPDFAKELENVNLAE